jgi:hypothetical protein
MIALIEAPSTSPVTLISIGPWGPCMVNAMVSVLPFIVPVSAVLPAWLSISPVTFSPSCVSVAVALTGPSGP